MQRSPNTDAPNPWENNRNNDNHEVLNHVFPETQQLGIWMDSPRADAAKTTHNIETLPFPIIFFTFLHYLIALRNLRCCHRLFQTSCFPCETNYFNGLHPFSETFWSAILHTKHARFCNVWFDYLPFLGALIRRPFINLPVSLECILRNVRNRLRQRSICLITGWGSEGCAGTTAKHVR